MHFIPSKLHCFTSMEKPFSPLIIFFIIFISDFPHLYSPYRLHPSITASTLVHRTHTAVSDFHVINRRTLFQCPDPNPFLQINVSKSSTLLSNEEFVAVIVSGVLVPMATDWIAMISPSHSNIGSCLGSKSFYVQTGDLSDLPLLCHYPVKVRKLWYYWPILVNFFHGIKLPTIYRYW
ncbi:hypothetical protein ERO13_D13G014102v2 [Gossypium hirsutum]|uniref:Purple acid phosphatase Fn3-like domain-containing protein n=1 Tax=Gossypium raimondii TaxID=29730 RepID=A0A0D2V7X7_GOSRA|nr:hypothetical protein ERO13_D13G014102v2 [Gossypium hirsutum]KJB78736.1 hypothetical protein B456_013G015300 [Gossypium raimondii]